MVLLDEKLISRKDGDECVVIVVDVPKYRGPPLCGAAIERRTRIPIRRQEATWYTGRKGQTCKREQFPLTLSFAVTIHKSQGSSFAVPVVVDIGKADQTCGSTYVAMSRCTASDQIFHNGYARDRIKKNFASPAFICRMKEEKVAAVTWSALPWANTNGAHSRHLAPFLNNSSANSGVMMS